MKNNKVKIFLLTLITLIIFIATIFLFNKISFGANISVDTNEHTYWDGSISTSLSGSGTNSNPYLIQNGADLEYFLHNSTAYKNKYITITNDIYLNEGYFDYNQDIDITIYYLNGNKYYVNNSKYYSDPLFQNEVGSIKTSSSKAISEAIIDGGNHSIIGLYSNNSYIFSINGTKVKNINFLNCVITGSDKRTGLISDASGGTNTSAEIENIIFNGIIKNNKQASFETRTASSPSNNRIYLSNNTLLHNTKSYSHNIITGTASNSFIYDGVTYQAGNFTLKCTPGDINTTITVTPKTSGQNVTFTNLANKLYYYEDVTGFISEDFHDVNSQLTINGITIRGYIIGNNIVGGILGGSGSDSAHNSGKIIIKNSSNFATLCNGKIMGGIIGYLKKDGTLIRNFNVGQIESDAAYSGGIIGYLSNPSVLNISGLFNDSSNNMIGYNNSSNVINFNYTSVTSKNDDPIIDNNHVFFATSNNIKTLACLESLLSFVRYSSGGKWILNEGEYPHLYFEDYTPPTINIQYQSNTWSENNQVRTLNKIYVDSIDNNYISVSATDSNDIAKIEYYNDGTIRTSSVNIDNIPNNSFNLLTSDSITINPNTSNTIYVKSTDIYGNVSWSCTDTIIFHTIQLNPTKGSNHQTLNKYSNGTIIVNNNPFDQLNLRYNSDFEITSFPYNNDTELYFSLCIEDGGYLPPNSFITLYDYKTDKIYELEITDDYNNNNVVTIDEYEYYRLSDFKEVGNSNINFDGRIISYYNNSKINFDFEIMISESVFSVILSTNNTIAFISNNQLINTVNSYGRDIFLENNSKITPNFSLSNYNSNYNGDNINTTIDYSLAFQTGFDFNNISYINKVNDHFYDLKSYIIKIELVDSNNNVINNTAPCNLRYKVSNINYNCKTNGATYIPIGNNTSGQINITNTYTSPRFIDVVNGNYNLRFTAYNKYNNDYSSSKTIPITINTATPINGVSFDTIISKEDRIISTSGITSSGNSTFHIYSKYTGVLTSPKEYFRIYKIEQNNENITQTEINPSSIFNFGSSSITYNNKTYYYIRSLSSQNTQYTNNLTLQNNLTSGNYIMEIVLFANNKFISSEQYNIMIK